MSHRLWFFILGLFLASGLLPRTAMGAQSPQLAASLRTITSLYARQQWSQAATQAQKALRSAPPGRYATQRARLYLYLGASLYQMKHRALAWSAFENALTLNPAVKLPPGANGGLKDLFARAQKTFRPSQGDTTQPTKRPPPQPAPTGRVHVGWILGWVSVTLTGAALGVATVAGGNAFVNAQEASNLVRKARSQSYSQVLMEPIVNDLHGRATTYGTVANVSYAVAGATALGAVGFFLWAYFASRPQAPAAKASLPGTTPLLTKSLHPRPTHQFQLPTFE